MTNENRGELSPFEVAFKMKSHEEKIAELEAEMKHIKPIVYETASSVKAINKSVSGIEENSRVIKNAVIGAIFSVLTGVLVFFLTR